MEDENKEVLTEREKELIDRVANLEQDKANLTGELIETRKKREPQEQKETPVIAPNTDPKDVVLQVLAERDNEQVKINLEQAKEELKRTVRELSPDVDQGGILFAKFEKELNKFNLTNLKTKEQFAERFSEAFKLMSNTSDKPTKINYYNGTNDNSGSDAKADDGGTLGASEQKLIHELGWTKDKYLSVKSKKPHYVASLLKYRQ
jgi:predicted 3-demethylubiquinone-9 3-methyltransferase (glyoxalase superfamily)